MRLNDVINSETAIYSLLNIKNGTVLATNLSLIERVSCYPLPTPELRQLFAFLLTLYIPMQHQVLCAIQTNK